jgi:hypothetical protein
MNIIQAYNALLGGKEIRTKSGFSVMLFGDLMVFDNYEMVLAQGWCMQDDAFELIE